MNFKKTFEKGKAALSSAATQGAQAAQEAAVTGANFARNTTAGVLKSKTTHRLANFAVGVAVDGAFAAGEKLVAPAGIASNVLLGKKGKVVNRAIGHVAVIANEAISDKLSSGVTKALTMAADAISTTPATKQEKATKK